MTSEFWVQKKGDLTAENAIGSPDGGFLSSPNRFQPIKPIQVLPINYYFNDLPVEPGFIQADSTFLIITHEVLNCFG